MCSNGTVYYIICAKWHTLLRYSRRGAKGANDLAVEQESDWDVFRVLRIGRPVFAIAVSFTRTITRIIIVIGIITFASLTLADLFLRSWSFSSATWKCDSLTRNSHRLIRQLLWSNPRYMDSNFLRRILIKIFPETCSYTSWKLAFLGNSHC